MQYEIHMAAEDSNMKPRSHLITAKLKDALATKRCSGDAEKLESDLDILIHHKKI